jgi:tripartite-type tricarboxylate transporter receptor subunit TctC
MTHVPYRGSAPAIQDLLGGQVEAFFDSIASALPHIRSGKLRALAVTGARRSPLLPDVKTMVESGVAGYVTESRLSLLAPKATPATIVSRLNREVLSIFAETETVRRLSDIGFEAFTGTPQDCMKLYEVEVDHWRPLVKSSGARVD